MSSYALELKILNSTKLKVISKTDVLTLSLSIKNTKQMFWGNLLLTVDIFCRYSAEYFSKCVKNVWKNMKLSFY